MFRPLLILFILIFLPFLYRSVKELLQPRRGSRTRFYVFFIFITLLLVAFLKLVI